MIEKDQIENILSANGVPATADDEVIRSVLLSARWDNNDVDTAMLVLKENRHTKESHVDTLHKVFHTDNHLSAADISKLLGVDVQISGDDVAKIRQQNKEVGRRTHNVAIALVVVAVLSSLTIYMYVQKIGIFHPSSTLFK